MSVSVSISVHTLHTAASLTYGGTRAETRLCMEIAVFSVSEKSRSVRFFHTYGWKVLCRLAVSSFFLPHGLVVQLLTSPEVVHCPSADCIINTL